MKKPIAPEREAKAKRPDRNQEVKKKVPTGRGTSYTTQLVEQPKDNALYLKQIEAWEQKELLKDKAYDDAMRLYQIDYAKWEGIEKKIKEASLYKVGDGSKVIAAQRAKRGKATGAVKKARLAVVPGGKQKKSA